MNELNGPIGQAFRRLRIQRFLAALVWSWGIGLTAAAVGLAAGKLLGRAPSCPVWHPFAIVAGLGLVAATALAIFSGPSRFDAALALDRAFQLDERLSTAVSLPDDRKHSPAGLALLADAVQRVKHLDVRSKFSLRPPRRAWLIVIPAVLALVASLVPPWSSRSIQARTTEDPARMQAAAGRTEELARKIAGQRQTIDKRKFPETDELLGRIEKKTEELAKAPPARKDKMAVELDKLSAALKERQRRLGTPEQVKRQLQQLRDLAARGLGDEAARALMQGDYQKAADALKELQEKLTSDQMSPQEKEALRKQLDETARKLKDLAELKERKEMLDQARKNGALSEQEFEREVEKLRDQAAGMEPLQQLADNLAQAVGALARGEMGTAAEQLDSSRQALEEMARRLEEIQTLDSALAEVADAKRGILGDGFAQRGKSLIPGAGGDSDRRGMDSRGGGRGRGRGDRPEAEEETSTFTSQVKQQLGKGKGVFQGFVPPGKAVKGEARIGVQAELDAGGGFDAAPLSNQKIPKSLEKHVRAYYDQINAPR